MEVAALTMLNNSGAVQHLFLSRMAHVFQAKVWGGTESVRNYFLLKKENERLVQENFTLAEKVRALESRPDSLLLPVTDGEFKFIPGKIVKISRNKQHNYIILGQGFEDGVEPHSGIVTGQGVVGIIDAVSRHYSYALSFMNTELSVSARLGRDGTVGPLAWDGLSKDKAILKEIPLQFRFSPGDTVFTSGYSSMFPPDIPLGTTGESRIVNGATYEIEVKLFQNFGALRDVTIVLNTGREEIEELETQEDDL